MCAMTKPLTMIAMTPEMLAKNVVKIDLVSGKESHKFVQDALAFTKGSGDLFVDEGRPHPTEEEKSGERTYQVLIVLSQAPIS